MRHDTRVAFTSLGSFRCKDIFLMPLPQQYALVELATMKFVGASFSRIVTGICVMFMIEIQAAGIGNFDSKTTVGVAFSITAFPGPAIVFPPGGRPSP